MKNKEDLPIKRIIKEYKSGLSTVKLAKKYNCSRSIISDILKKHNINVTKDLNLPMKKIINEYKNGISTVELAKKYNCSDVTIGKKLKDAGVNVTKFIDLPMKKIINEYKNGVTLNNLAIKYKCGKETIRMRLKEIGIIKKVKKVNNLFGISRKFIDLPIKKIINEYENGISTNKLSDKYNCSEGVIYRILKNNNIIITKISNLPIKKIINEYESGMGCNELSKKYNCSCSVIKNRLEEFNVYIRSPKEAKNIISTHICVECKREYEGKSTSQYCDECNKTGYCYKYDENCKEHNREKYNRECFFCGKSEEENGRKLDTHHVDYNKNQGCDETPDWKLVPLCSQCHGITGGRKENRITWKARILYLHKEYWSEII